MNINYLKIFLGIFVALAASRFVPHPPNFTSLIALSFYVPALLGLRFLPAVVLSFVLTDIFIGYHNMLFFTWGSVIVIGFVSKYFISSFLKRLGGALSGACLFFLITNFGVWVTGYYGYSIDGLTASYVLALPFFGYTLVSTLIFSVLIETVYKFSKFNFKNI
tara:strand:+ start:230 stop:718 length:489 start_codon:yes stop_codon:yes gene_type:complete